MEKSNQHRITSIGGSALIEGIMMRGPKRTTVAVRTGENDIYTEDISIDPIAAKSKIWKVPIIRGVAGLIDSMRLSYKALELSANKAIDAGVIEEEEPSKFEKWLEKTFGDKLMKVVMVIATVLGIALAIALFFFLPTYLYKLLCWPFPSLAENVIVKSIFEGVLKIVIFLLYIVICSKMEDMKRVFMYHGAEHKTIFCYEAYEELTVENIKKQSRFHPRCGTSFLVIALLLGIIVGLFIPPFPTLSFLRPIIKILLLPLMVGIGYELIKLCGKYDNKITHIIAAPGLWAQRITTKEPDDKMIECAIVAMKAVIPEDGSDIINDDNKGCCK